MLLHACFVNSEVNIFPEKKRKKEDSGSYRAHEIDTKLSFLLRFSFLLPRRMARPLRLHCNVPQRSPSSCLTYEFSRPFPRSLSGSSSAGPLLALHCQPSLTIVYLCVSFTTRQQVLCVQGTCLFCVLLCPWASAWRLEFILSLINIW